MDSAITGGEFRGRKILSPKISATHPMGARERLALFNAVGARKSFIDAKVLDTYAGTGALGLEALSRGARKAVFIEKDQRALGCLRENIKNLGVGEQSLVVGGNVARFVTDEEFDIIFVDPPYDKFEVGEFIHLKEYLGRNGLFVVSHPGALEVEIAGLRLVSDKKYAGAGIAIFDLGF